MLRGNAVRGEMPRGSPINVNHDPIGGIVTLTSWDNDNWVEIQYWMFQDERLQALKRTHSNEISQIQNAYDTLSKKTGDLSHMAAVLPVIIVFPIANVTLNLLLAVRYRVE